MDARRVTDALSVSPQISPEDVADIAAAGYRSIVCNRPDGEAPDQTSYSEIEAAAKSAGLETVWQPVLSGTVRDSDGERFGEIVSSMPAPVFAYCRSGTRCIVLWSLSQAQSMAADDIVSRAAEVGYDLGGLMPRLEAIKAAGK